MPRDEDFEGFVRNHLIDISTRVARLEERSEGLPARVSKLEAHRNWLAGAIATVGAAGALLFNIKA